ncbi:RNAPII degradation factor [Neocucurbitaria cava]|uniref:RNA polymerase II degradation factor 1 n=1 Tax=Neocucurbitaria cava TaxID=798079 RepID=A0A9W9CS96_9PLEO|nr:RNAPII degradation factor [Neocucurbitaria cava]
MSEVQSRPARGRSSARGGRGSYGSRGPRKTNGDSASSNIDTSADQGELGELKKRYQSQLSTLKELFPDWSDAELVLAIEDSNGDLETTIEKISEGAVSQFAEVPKKAKDRSRSKAKENVVPADGVSSQRGSRGEGPRRGGDSVRGGRGRGTDRGRGGLRGGRGGSTTGPRAATGSVPTTESPAWEVPPVAEDPKENGQATEHTSMTEKVAEPVAAVAAAAKKTWASMFAAPKPPPAVPKPAAKHAPAPGEPTPTSNETPAHEVAQEPSAHVEDLPIPPIADEVVAGPALGATEDTSKLTPDKGNEGLGPEVTLTPSKDELTVENVEHLPDESHPPPTETAFSTVASSKDIGSAVATPLSGPTQAPIGRPGIGGYATSALKATSGTPHRSASFQRRLQEQQEAVVMPGNHAVDRAAVQFGSLGLGDASDLDVDEDREEAETRTQPPQHSPVTQPRASLPPAPRQAPQSEPQQQESLPTPKQAPGLPPAPQQQPLSQQSPSNPLASQAMQNQGSQSNQSYNQFGRYGQTGIQSEASAPPQKPYDPFGQQIPQSNQYDYPGQQSQAPSQPGAFSSAPDNFASQYLTSEQRSQYQNYYGSYGQQNAQSQQEAGSAQQRTGSGFGSGPNESTYSQGQQQQQSQSRYNDAQNSGHNTPNPALGGQQGPASQNQHMQQQHGQQGHAGGYPYNHPYYGSPYYANYMNQFGGYGQGGGYGSFGKGMYGQPHHYGMSPQASFEHSSSPANAGGFGASSLHERGSGMGGGFGDYGRSASGTSQNPSATSGSGGFGGLPDTFSRPGQGYSNQSSYGQQQGGQQGLGEDSLKPFGDSKSGGPSPSALGAQPGRPGSATQNTPSQSGQGGLPQHSQQQGFGGYPGHLSGNNQYGGLGGLGHQNSAGHQQQQQQQSGYGNYGGFGGYGGGSYNRGGWGGNYGQH